MKQVIFVLLLCIICTRCSANPDKPDAIEQGPLNGNRALNNFVKSAMVYFAESVLDDPLVLTGNRSVNTRNPLFKLTGKIAASKYYGFSAIATDEVYIASRISSGYFVAELPILTSKLTGVYDLDRRILNTMPMKGNGQWSVSSDSGGFYIELDFETENGYLIPSGIYLSWGLGYGSVISFPGLLDESIQEDIVNEINPFLVQMVAYASVEEIREAIFYAITPFLQNTFQEYSLVDILSGSTFHPPTKASLLQKPSAKMPTRRFQPRHDIRNSKF